ncbi:MAG: hypothetical protein H0T42_01395, partial [Deltaproteobacteria bacterium]|nr:hypothetical protein [Deltaproteobacteria bacterium]
MPDDERTRRRLGDETKARIADLSSGWSVDPEVSAVPLAPPLGRRTPSPEDGIQPVMPASPPATRIPVPAITPPS